MKKIILLALVLVGMMSVQSCKTDFDIAAPFKPYTIVYGLLSQNDSAHYIRIQKAFLDDSKSALVMNKVADSNYWPNLNVVMKELQNGTVINTYTLQKVDMAQEGYVKQPGDSSSFFTSPNYAYKLKHALNDNYRYRLVITNPDTKEVDSSETPIINGNFYVREFNMAAFNLTFTNFDDYSAVQMQGSMPNNANSIEGFIRFKYVDKVLSTGAQTDRYFDMKLPDALIPGFAINNGSIFEYKILNKDILTEFATQIPDADNNLGRYLDSAEIYIYTGGEVLTDYIKISRTQGTGLTSDQIQPKFTNIKGAHALGILSTRAYRVKYNIPIAELTINALKTNPMTIKKNILGRSDH